MDSFLGSRSKSGFAKLGKKRGADKGKGGKKRKQGASAGGGRLAAVMLADKCSQLASEDA